MASKIFREDMPELMEKILNNLNNEFYSLYSCALVSRYWCKMSIPILWQNPFILKFNLKPLFISNYFSFLNNSGKVFLLTECGIVPKLSKTLFNYARFLKVLELTCVVCYVIKWIEISLGTSFILNKKSKLCVNRIINLLLKVFIEGGATLHKLNLSSFGYIEIKPKILYLMGQYKQFFSQLKYLVVGKISDISIESSTTLLRILAKSAMKLNVLKLGEFDPDCKPQVFHVLISIIKSQGQLRRFKLVGEEYPEEFRGIISALESQKQSLREVKIKYCNYSAEFNVLSKCENLEILRMGICDYKLLNTIDYKISTLEIVDSPIEAPPIVLFLETSGTLLQRIKIDSSEVWEEQSSLIKAIKSFCPNVKYLNLFIDFSTQLLELIGNLQKLQFLTLCLHDVDIPEEEIKMRYKQFSEILPPTLEYLDLIDTRFVSYINIWLNNCSSPLKRLLINSLNNVNQAKALIEFYIQKRTLNYVGVCKYSDLNDNIKREVEGFVALVKSERIVDFYIIYLHKYVEMEMEHVDLKFLKKLKF